LKAELYITRELNFLVVTQDTVQCKFIGIYRSSTDFSCCQKAGENVTTQKREVLLRNVFPGGSHDLRRVFFGVHIEKT
jgi:hypothetical protein